MFTREYILAEIRRVTSGGVPPGRRRFENETGVKESDWLGRHWARWSDAVREAGYEPNAMQTPYSEEHLLECLANLTRELNHFPTSPELRMRAREDASFPNDKTFYRLGSMAERARHLAEFCTTQEIMEDVAEIARQREALAPVKYDSDQEGEDIESAGFVYLMKSGKYHKVGRSSHPERRQYEIRLRLPEPLKLIHRIKTDDPVGVEAYWHKRFASKRKEGEWFKLSKEDVAAFRHRNVM